MPSAPNARARSRVLGRVGVRSNTQPSLFVGPGEHRLEVLARPRRDERDGADEDATRAAVDRDDVAFDERVRPERWPFRAASSICRSEHPATHGLPMPRATTAAWEVMPPCTVRIPSAAIIPWMSSGVVSKRTSSTGPDSCALDCTVGVEHDAAAGGAGRGIQALPGRLDRCVRIDHRMQELVELRRVECARSPRPGDQTLVDHRDGCLERRCGRALRRSRLEQEQAIVLDRELDVLHVAVMALEAAHRVDQLRVGTGKQCPHRLDRLRRSDACDDVLALGVREELPVGPRLAGRRVPGERDAGPGALALVAEDHLHDADGCAEVVRDLVRTAVDPGARGVPRLEHGLDCAQQLCTRVVGKLLACVLAVDLPERPDQRDEVVGVEVGVVLHTAFPLQRGQRAVEAMGIDAGDHLAEHVDEPTVRVVREARVSRPRSQSGGCSFAEPDVEDRVHHPRHRDRCARTDRDEQRVVAGAEASTRVVLEASDVPVDLGLEALGQPPGLEVGAARVRRDREAVRDGDPELRHLDETHALAPEQLAAAGRRLVEVEDVANCHCGTRA